MNQSRDRLRDKLEDHYRGCGWRVSRRSDGTIQAAGPGGVTWHATPIVAEDLEDSERLDARLLELANIRMPQGGELCPLELIAAQSCEAGLRDALGRTGLNARPHVSVYELSAAAA